MADITKKMLDVRIGTSNEWAEENLSLVAGNLYYVDLLKNDSTASGAMALFLSMGTEKKDARYLTTLMPSALDASVTGDVAVGDTLVTALSKLNNKITSVAEDAAKMFTIRGTIGTDESGADRQGLPPTAEKGDAWRIITKGSYELNGKYEPLEIGDWVICSFVSADGTPSWVVLPANLDLSSVTFNGSYIGDNGFEIKLSGSGVDAGTTVPFANASKGGLLSAGDFKKLNDGELVYKSTKASGSAAGVVMLIDATDSDKSEGYAATPKAVKLVKDALDTATTRLSDEQKEIVQGIEVDNATHSTDSKKILVQNEASTDFHSDVHVFAKDEGDNAGIRLHTNDKSDKVIVNEADHSALADAIVVEGKEYAVKAVEIEKDDTKEIRLQSTDENGIVLSVDHADLADDLGGRQETTPEEFIYQPTAGEYTSIKDGMASIKSLKGNSVVWNQLISSAQQDQNDVSFRMINGVVTLKGTATGTCYFKLHFTTKANHKYICSPLPSSFYGPESATIYNDNQGLVLTNTNRISTATGIGNGYIIVNSGTTIDETFPLQIHDLTQMFGEGNEPTTAEEFNARKPKVADEYAYNEGEIISFNGDAIKSVGFNQFDGQLELGRINEVNGSNQENPVMVRSKNYIPVISGAKYYFNVQRPNNDFVYIYPYYYDKDKNYISNTYFHDEAPGVEQTIPSNVAFMRFFLYQNNASFKPNDFTDKICINLVHTGFRNKEYEPYTEHTLYLPREAQDMKSAGTAFDEIYFDEAKKKYFKVQRMSEVDLGDLKWYYETNLAYPRFSASMPSSGNERFNILCALYKASNSPIANSGVDKTMGYYPLNNTLYIYNFAYTDAATFKTAMKGVKLIYELAEPIITEITDYEGYMDYPVSDFGTEEVLSLGNTSPIKADIQYGFNAVDTIRNNRLDITELRSGVREANETATSAFSSAEQAEMYAKQANNLSNYILDDIATIKLEATENDGKVVISLKSDGITVGDEIKEVDTDVQIPNATSGNYGLMSPDHVDKLNNLYKPTVAIGVVTTVAELKTKLDTWLNNNKGKIVAATFQCSTDWRYNWSDTDKQNTVFGTGSRTWTAQVIAAYSTDANHVCLMISSYSKDNQCIVYRASGVWSTIRQIAFTDTMVDAAALADKAKTAEKATSDSAGNNIVETYVQLNSGSEQSIQGDIEFFDNTITLNGADIKCTNMDEYIGTYDKPFRHVYAQDFHGFLDGTAHIALLDVNEKEIVKTYAKADDLAAIKSALTWKPFTNSN